MKLIMSRELPVIFIAQVFYGAESGDLVPDIQNRAGYMALHSPMVVNIQYSLLGVSEQNVIHMNSLVVLSSF